MINVWLRRTVSLLLVLALVHCEAEASTPDRKDLQSFTDAFFKDSMERYHVPGAVISIVQNGTIAYMNGYGLANLKDKKPVDPKETRFRVGSLAKLMTATAVMQLYERGQIDLHTSIQAYAPDLDIDYFRDAPITFHHLLTHTAGFPEMIYEVGRDQNRQLTLSEAIEHHTADPIRKPGEQTAYSNFGMSLAGYLVERIASMPYSEYVDRHIFSPLQMENSGFAVDEASSDLAVSYTYDKGSYHSLPYAYTYHIPSGSLVTTAEDMAQFILAHLGQGKPPNGSRILKEQTAQLMHQTQFTLHERIPGMAYGFTERYVNGQRLIGSDAEIDGFSANLYLLPSEDTGIFMAANSGGGVAMVEAFIKAYLDQYHPAHETTELLNNPTPAQELRKLEGFYIPSRAHLVGPLNFTQNLSAVKVEVIEDGVVTLDNERYVEAEPYLFRQEQGTAMIYLDKDKGLLASSTDPKMLYELKPASYHPALHLILFAAGALLYPIQALISIIRRVLNLLRVRKTRAADLPETAVSILFILYFLFAVSTPELFVHTVPWWAYPLLFLPVLCSAALFVRVIMLHIRKRRPGAAHYAFAAVTLLFTIYMYMWGFFQLS
ncbi:serine hydrolase domain-containing protein [Paenibacillus tarimensis]|uniref:serine hydrolase domain-containing protein n=1 Tax=Paenibacillus tarimensis TaxID=416012 RepID=UPI001F3AA924|nr:serine hydrolase domain-containing protein [Paenibacillus tarimensis]MCF2945779.1 beta-lactamase family protein [Paenibacillus tarimensis]